MATHLTESDCSKNPELVALVSAFIDGNITTEEKEKLERYLIQSEAAQDYCAAQIRFEAELTEHMQPLKVEMTQKRHLVFERKHGIPRITARESHVTRIGNPNSDTFLELPPGLEDASVTRKRITFIIVALFLLVGALTALLIWQANRPELIVSQPPARLELRNAGFEETDLSLGSESFNYSIPSWHEFFQSYKALTISPLKAKPDDSYPPNAHSGNNVAKIASGSYITQRLLYTDNKPLLAKQGLHLRVHGWAYVHPQDTSGKLRFAIRHVKNIHPAMLQYEPAKKIIDLQAGEWRKFQVDLKLPKGSLLDPSDIGRNKTGHEKIDITGKALNLSIDNRYQSDVFLDDLSIEIIKQSTKNQ